MIKLLQIGKLINEIILAGNSIKYYLSFREQTSFGREEMIRKRKETGAETERKNKVICSETKRKRHTHDRERYIETEIE